jgi:uridine kinase
MIIAIDGRSASGKTTLAARLASEINAQVIHTDDFFLPREMRTEERFNQPGGNVHYERFIEEVLPFLKNGETFSYKIFDCARGEYNGEKKIAAAKNYIVEGAYSCHPFFGAYMGVKIFCDVTRCVQLERIKIRNGEEAVKIFLSKWIPLEEKYFAAYKIKHTAHITI